MTDSRLIPPPGLPPKGFVQQRNAVHHKGSVPFLLLLCIFLGLGGAISGLNYVLLGLSLPTSTLLGTTLALVPLGMLSWFYAWLDSGETENRRMFISAFMWGAVGATGFALVLNTVAVSAMGTFVGVAIFAPFVEESLKGLFLFALFWWRKSHFDGPLDGIVYAGFVAMGFAFVENITYFTAAYSGLSLLDDTTTAGGPMELIITFIMRGVVTPFAHPLFTAATGIGLGLALTAKTRGSKLFWALGGLGTSIMLHGLWNGIVTAGSPDVQVLSYFFFFIPLFLLYAYYAVQQHNMMNVKLGAALQELSTYGAVPPHDLMWLSSKDMRRTALAYAGGGKAGEKAMKAYLYYAIRFAALHIKVREGHAPADYVGRGQAYAEQLRSVRPYVYFPPPPTNFLAPRPIP